MARSVEEKTNDGQMDCRRWVRLWSQVSGRIETGAVQLQYSGGMGFSRVPAVSVDLDQAYAALGTRSRARVSEC